MRILIVEDDIIIAENHKEVLLDFGIKQVDISRSDEDALLQLKKNNFDLVLLDARLKNGMEGVELGQLISTTYNIPFIYLTANTDIESVKRMIATKPISYLSKPIRKSELFAAISLLDKKEDPKQEKVLSLKDGSTLFRFKKENVLYAQSSGNYVNIRFSNRNKSHLIRMSLDTFLNELNDPDFIRVSRFYVINLSNVEHVNKKTLSVGGEMIAYSREKYEEIVEKLGKVKPI